MSACRKGRRVPAAGFGKGFGAAPEVAPLAVGAGSKGTVADPEGFFCLGGRCKGSQEMALREGFSALANHWPQRGKVLNRSRVGRCLFRSASQAAFGHVPVAQQDRATVS
jgi:hypothetical protein